ncbi:hypothetical protein [Actinoplanes derwentensis]|uniref:NB-ARC domain-containing protein n=1 Tax=Actinoplanes derwentensis TaxID=113562 RepID=A0A1H2B8V0_9ACTN|nr:hypothetical protein [Actinoplanes derwentensis]GID86461.1 hypothetical protein Ade03nite_53850 [Actinoplanes derwentensis]SDT54618.1 hypothetical protein SAMN04489716_4429 [Actinoplanes derwentensis]
MWEALVAAIMTAVVTRAGEDVGKAAQSTWTLMVEGLRKRIGSKAAGDEEALREFLEKHPELATRMQAELDGTELTIPSPALPVPSAVWLLPAGPADFVNQVRALERLDGIRGGDSAGATPVVVVGGPPGSGKTATSLRWAHQRREWFGGGQLYADMREIQDPVFGGPPSSDPVVTAFLLALGVPGGLLPDTAAGRLSLYRTRTAGEPVLVLLRGAALPAQISPLIPTAPGSVMLVSTQHDVRGLAMDGAHFIEVEPLDDAAARDLLAAVCGRDRVDEDPAATGRLIALCGRLPLALRVVGGRLRLDTTLTVPELADELAGEPYLLDALALPGAGGSAVEPLFNNVYRHLSEDGRLLYRDLGAVPVTEISDALLTRIGWPDRRARRAAIDQLLGLRLLERAGRDRFAPHPLVRAHGARLATETDPGRAERVVADTVGFVCEWAESADRAIMGERRRLISGPVPPDGPFAGENQRARALQALEAGREDLLRVARIGLELGADEQVLRLATAAQALWFNHPHLAAQAAMSDLAITAARRLGRPDVEIQIHCTLAGAHSTAGDLDRARAEIRTAFGLLPAANDRKLAGTVWEFHARLLDRVARAAPEAGQAAARAEAETAFRTTIDTFQAVGLDRGVALGRFYYGMFLDAAGRPDDAREQLEQARDGLNAAGDDRNAARADAAIGAVHLRLGHFRRAYDELAASAAYFAVAELWRYELGVREDLIVAANALGDRAAVAQHTDRAAEIRRLSEPGQ